MTLVFRNLLEHPDVQGILVRVDRPDGVRPRGRAGERSSARAPIGIFEVDLDDRCTFVNPAFERLTGLAAHDALGDGWRRSCIPTISRRCGPAPDATECDEPCVVELRISRRRSSRGGSARGRSRCAARTASSPATSARSKTSTERKVLEERLEHDATHDRLTGLGSRALLVEQVTCGAGADPTRRARRRVVVHRPRRVQARERHARPRGRRRTARAGRAAARGASVRDADVCVRLGGDEFVVCCIDVGSPADQSTLLGRAVARMRSPNRTTCTVTKCSSARASASRPRTAKTRSSVDQLLSNADIASYRAKRLGRGRVEIFDDELRRRLARGPAHRAQRRPAARRAARCRSCARRSCISRTESVVGFDCAVDWDARRTSTSRRRDRARRRRGGDVARRSTSRSSARCSPSSRSGSGARRARSFPALQRRADPRRARSSPVLPEMVRDMLTRTRVDAVAVLARDPGSRGRARLRRRVAASSSALDELGVGVALRDFGSAVSSLEQLRRLPTPTMTRRPDRSSRRCTATTRTTATATLLAAIVQYARALGRIVVAFGVQDEAHTRAAARARAAASASVPAFGPRAARPTRSRRFSQRRRVALRRDHHVSGAALTYRVGRWPAAARTPIPPSTSRCSRASIPCASGRACTSDRPVRPACTT